MQLHEKGIAQIHAPRVKMATGKRKLQLRFLECPFPLEPWPNKARPALSIRASSDLAPCPASNYGPLHRSILPHTFVPLLHTLLAAECDENPPRRAMERRLCEVRAIISIPEGQFVITNPEIILLTSQQRTRAFNLERRFDTAPIPGKSPKRWWK